MSKEQQYEPLYKKPGDSEAKSGCCSSFFSFLKSTNFLLYVSHTLTAGGDRMWTFAVGLFLINLTPYSLRLTAIYGLVSGGSILLIGPLLGDIVDKNPRLKVAQASLLVNNISIVVCAAIVSLTLVYLDDVEIIWDGWLAMVCQIGIVMTATVGDLASETRRISIERDWIVVMCAGDKIKLTELSAFLRRIDLVTNLAAPIITGQVITYGSYIIGAAFLGAWNIGFMFVEYGLLYIIYKRIPALAIKHVQEPGISEEQKPLVSSNEHAEVIARQTCCDITKVCSACVTVGRGWKLYLNQDILPAGIALALLYMTVMGFDNVTNGYAVQQGLTESMVGILRGVGSILGVLGTLLFPVLRKHFGLSMTGVISFGWFVTALIPCVVSLFVAGSPFKPDFYINPGKYIYENDTDMGFNSTIIPDATTVNDEIDSVLSIWLLMGAMVVARSGLWMSDLTVTQLLIEEPPDNVRGIINGVQSALNKFMDLIKFVLVIFLPRQETFGFLVLASFFSIFCAFVSFNIYACNDRRKRRNEHLSVPSSKSNYEEV